MNDLYMVIDCNTYGVLCFARTPAAANSVSLGFINSLSEMLPYSLPKREKMLKEQNLDLANDVLKVFKGNLFPLDEHLQTPVFLEQRRIARLRAAYIYSLETHLKKFTVRSNLQFDPENTVYLMEQIRRSNPANDEFALGIHEYAAIHDIEPAVAYQEISMILDTNGLIKTRSVAVYNKYVQKFNECTTDDQCQGVFSQLMDDILYKAQI
jgi:hypothetical protein